MPRERATDEDLIRALVGRLRGATTRTRTILTGEDGEGGTPLPPASDNPMEDPGDLIRGGTAGAMVRLAIGTDGEVLTVVSGLPAWAAAGAVASGSYRQFVIEADGAGSWGFVSEDDGSGQLWPVMDLYATE